MHPLLLILGAPFVWKFAIDYGKKYDPPEKRRRRHSHGIDKDLKDLASIVKPLKSRKRRKKEKMAITKHRPCRTAGAVSSILVFDNNQNEFECIVFHVKILDNTAEI